MYGNDQNTKLLVHFDGTNTSTSFFDSSPVFGARAAHLMTAFGAAQVDTSQSVFGGASGKFANAGDYITTPDSSEFDLGAAVFTVDFRIRPSAFTAATGFVDGTVGAPIINHIDGAGGGWLIGFDANNLTFLIRNLLSGTTLGQYHIVHAMVVNTWYHFSFSRTAVLNTFAATRNGVVAPVIRDNNLTNAAIPHPATALTIGGRNTNTSAWIDELRLSPGVQRTFSANFPIEPYDAPANPNMFNYHMTDRYIAEAARPLLIPCA